jgi:hypothetical protein
MIGRGLTECAIELKKKRAFRKFSYRGVDLDQYVVALPESHALSVSGLIVSYADAQSADSSTSLPKNCATSFTPVPAVDSTVVSSASPWV